ncbi:hypothetical protein [Streptomyces sp. NPDC093149]|uniref:hypothetical protein n=1 Tax=Streptomyces sp. NPDC093149 TaxID=3366031 RepID=UPI00380BEF35
MRGNAGEDECIAALLRAGARRRWRHGWFDARPDMDLVDDARLDPAAAAVSEHWKP